MGSMYGEILQSSTSNNQRFLSLSLFSIFLITITFRFLLKCENFEMIFYEIPYLAIVL